MKLKKGFSLLLCLCLILSLLPINVMAKDSDKTFRRVYLHGFDDARPLTDTTDTREIKKADNTYVYLAVDDPNKEDPNGDEQWEQQFNLGGFTVKIYYDTKYFELADKNSTTPIEYKFVADWADDSVEGDFGDYLPDDDKDEINETKVGFMTVAHGNHVKDNNPDSRIGYAYATIFYKGGKLPELTKNKDNWYNILRLPLKPIETGRTSVYIEIMPGDEYTLELFAKNVPNSDTDGDDIDDIERNFQYYAENGGVFNFNIVDETKPNPPIPDPAPSIYTEAQYVRLITDEPGTIYYKTDGMTEFDVYGVYDHENGIPITYTQDIQCYVVREKDGAVSNTKTYRYIILPPAPELFNSKDEFIPSSYTENWATDSAGFKVYATDHHDTSTPIENEIYYTFNTQLSADLINDETDNPYVGTNAEISWKKITANDGSLGDLIDRRRTVRLVTVNGWGHSDVATYYLGVKPGDVIAIPGEGHYSDVELNVKLECHEPESAEIYYTRNDGDPRANGTLYDGELTLTYDTKIVAVSKYKGEWGEPTTFMYHFDRDVMAYYPPGEYVGSIDVSLFPKKDGQQVEYSIDGGEWKTYEEPITIDKDTEIKAKIKGTEGEGISLVYEIKPYPPVFAPETTQLTEAEWISVYAPESTKDTTEQYEILYTTDGSDPITSPTANKAENSTYDEFTDEVRIYVTDYEEIKAVVVKDGKYYSDVVTHTYEVVHDRPATPVTTVKPGYYVHDFDNETIETLFEEVPDGVEIYYTVNSDGAYVPNPDMNDVESGITKHYDGTTPIDIKGNTVIKAVAVAVIDGVTVKSNIGVYTYTVIPEAPIALESGEIDDYQLIPIDSVYGEDCIVEYEINGIKGSFKNNDSGRFYLDLKTGNAYRTPDTSEEPLCKLDMNIETPVALKIKTILDGVSSSENSYVYVVDAQANPLPPYADKASGTYTESKTDFEVNLYSPYEDDENVKIQWKFDGETEWKEYTGTISFPTEDKVINVRAVNEATAKISPATNYVYYFAPPAPIITLPSGVYIKEEDLKTIIQMPDDLTDKGKYRIFFQISEAEQHGERASNVELPLTETTSVKAFLKNENTDRISEVVSAYYILQDKKLTDGVVRILSPYNVDKISAHELGTGAYAEGIKLARTGNGTIKYQYRYKVVDGTWTTWTDIITYDEINPIIPTVRMDEIEIIAWIDGNKEATKIQKTIDFVHLGVPTVKLDTEPDSSGNYKKKTNYWVQNEYAEEPNVVVFYTTDKTNPDPFDSTKTQTHFSGVAEGNKETLLATTTVKAMYYLACGRTDCTACGAGNYHECKDGIEGDTVTYTYPVKTTAYGGGGGGGGGGTVTIDKTRRYTVDIFGQEHPTHIGYINGYPDGSVQPEGNITREEMTAILYRVRNKQYEKPFETSGDIFPDVKFDRWSVTEIEYMANDDVVLGYPDGEFKPSRNLTRAEFASLICRFTKLDKNTEVGGFPDVTEEHWAYEDIMTLCESGLVQGYEDGTFRPEREISRAEVMTVVNKILGRNPSEEYVKSLDFNPFNDLFIDRWYYVTVLEATITHNYYLEDKTDLEIKWEDCK